MLLCRCRQRASAPVTDHAGCWTWKTPTQTDRVVEVEIIEVTEVSDSLRTLLAQSIDYAGALPPAGVPLDEALKSYARHRRQSGGWMLGRFVCPVEHLPAMSAHEKLWRDRQTRVAVVGTSGAGAEDLQKCFQDDLQQVIKFLESHQKDARVESFELKLPSTVTEAAVESIASFVSGTGKALVTSNLSDVDVFLETPAGSDWELAATGLLRAIEKSDRSGFGINIRLGGLPDDDMPTVDQLAFFINSCRTAGVRWKATARRLWPLPRPGADSGQDQFGFLSLFAAAVLASVHRLTQSQVTSILSDSSISQFRFDQDAFVWGDYRANLPGIEQGRRQSICSLGSCSFDELLDGLADLGLGR